LQENSWPRFSGSWILSSLCWFVKTH